jgi:hypothetical protein
MTTEERYQRIGHLVLDSCPDLSGKLLVCAEVQEGVIESAVFYERGAGKVVTFRYCSDELEDALYELWQHGAMAGNRPWFGIEYVAESGRFQIDHTYLDQVTEDEGMLDRRPRLLAKHFGDRTPDYSMPGE